MEKQKKNGTKMTKADLEEQIVSLFQLEQTEKFSLKQIYKRLKLKTHPMKMLCANIIEDMTANGFLTLEGGALYRLSEQGQIIEGTFQRKSNGKNSLLPMDGGDPIFVAERNSGHAMNGDIVRIAMCAHRKGHQPEGVVTEIVKKTHNTFVGTLQVNKHYAFLTTNTNTLANDIFIPPTKLNGGMNGDKALVKVTEWPDDAKNPIGEVVDILGKAGNNNAEMHGILAEFGLPYKYPEDVEKAADEIPATITQADYNEREDYRSVNTFTIDPKDAKDFDDALSIKKLEDGTWEVGVHIADVTHYVKEGTIINKEAEQRATSVYLVDRTIPMLPERLCNFLCSLRQDEEKLAYSVIFKMNEQADVLKYRIVHTVIKSNRRFVYDEVEDILKANGVASNEDYEMNETRPPHYSGVPKGEFAPELVELDKLAKILRKQRFANGAIDFDSTEMKFDIDENGKPVNVYFKVSKDANKLVEEFMLLANRTVAESVGKVSGRRKPKTFPYRIHDTPDPDKMETLKSFITKFGYKLKTTGSKDDVAKSFNKLLNDVKGKKEQALIETVSLRAMMKARYSTDNIGHYGLAFPYYTHFTSPIRRFPDMMVHRLLTRYQAGGRSASKAKYEQLCEHSSAMEQLAATAERASIKYKEVEYMGERLGQVYDATISGVTEFGIYAEVNENKCEGMIPLRDLDDDYYEFDEKNYRIIGRRNHRVYNLGDPIKIRVARANLNRRLLDFALADSKKTNKANTANHSAPQGKRKRNKDKRKKRK